jgi:hypothetical protein
MKKVLVMLVVIGLGVAAAYAGGGGVGVFGTFMDTKDMDSGYGTGLKFKFDVAQYLAAELRASYVTKFMEDSDTYDNLYMIPVEADLLFNLPLGDSPVTIYAGGGGGYYILPEYETDVGFGDTDIDLDDTFGFYGIGGVEFALAENVILFAEAKYLFLEVDTATIDDMKVEGDDAIEFTGITGNAGILFRF